MQPDKLSERDRVALHHMVDAAEKILGFSKNRVRKDLDTDEMYALAVVRLLEVIGEAARRVSAGTRSVAPHIPWTQIIGTRDRLIHGYDDVEHDIVWTIISTELRPLVTEIRELLGSEG